MKRIFVGAVAIAGLALTATTPVKAHMTELEVLFIKADRNGDFVLNKSEFLIVALDQFDRSDSDRDNMLEKQEVGELSKDKEFSDNDTSKDGALSIEEVIQEKLADFNAADTNNDGSLTFDEVKKFYEGKYVFLKGKQVDRNSLKFKKMRPGETELVTKAPTEDGETIGARLTSDGRIALYGISFDLDKAKINAESNTTIREIAKFLKQNPKIKIAVVGHTDGTGSHEHNMTLSKKRANAVVQVLTKKHKIKKDRLLAAGVGFLAPVSANETDEGRGLNRRVEVVRLP